MKKKLSEKEDRLNEYFNNLNMIKSKFDEKNRKMSMEEILKNQKTCSRKPESFWNSLIKQEKSKQAKMKKQKTTLIEQAEGEGAGISREDQEALKHMLERSSVISQRSSNDSPSEHKKSMDKTVDIKRIMKTTDRKQKLKMLDYLQKKTILQSEYFFDNKPDHMSSSLPNINFEKVEGRKDIEPTYSQLDGTYDSLFPSSLS